MTLVYGKRTIWPASVPHWEIRRGFTVPAYSSPEFDRIIANTRLMADRLAGDPAVVIPHIYEGTYISSCLDLLESRLGFYANSMPASSYRRTSIDFKMTCLPELRVRACVPLARPDVVQIHTGLVLSIEDATHALLTVWERPFGLAAEPARPNAIPLGLAKRGHVDAFVDYSAAFSSAENLASSTRTDQETIPAVLYGLFLGVSADLTRQTFADHLSVVSLLWAIAHEDAHRYSGHLRLFQTLKMSEDDCLFDELVSTPNTERYSRVRRPAELEADTCATMRAVDYCFDSEFLGIITDWLPQDMREAIHHGRREADGLDAAQRLFLMRLLAVGAFLPLAVFDIAISANSQNNISNYPPFLIRALNVIFTIASRAVDVSLQQPAYRVGQFASSELATFFHLALEDFKNIHVILQVYMNGHESNIRHPWAVTPELVKAFFIAFFAYHGQSHVIGINSRIQPDALETQDDLIIGLIRERHAMDLACVETFADAKREVNSRRLDKVAEDIDLAQHRVDLARDAFDFLGPRHTAVDPNPLAQGFSR
jgi:hypothetical protein